MSVHWPNLPLGIGGASDGLPIPPQGVMSGEFCWSKQIRIAPQGTFSTIDATAKNI